MPRITYPRAEWAAVARELAATYGSSAPPGLAERVDALLAATRAGWPDEPCSLELDEAGADAVEAIVRRGRGLAADPGLAGQRRASVAEADELIRTHQRAPHHYRVEHRSGGRATVVGHTSSADARQSELSRHAARLAAEGATGELVLVDEATGEDVARRSLRPENDR